MSDSDEVLSEDDRTTSKKKSSSTKSKVVKEEKKKEDEKKDFKKTYKSYALVNEEGAEAEIRLYEYSEKSVMIQIPKSVGKKYSEILKEKGGKYNSRLSIKGEVTPGWIFRLVDKEKAIKAINKIKEKVLETDIDFEDTDN